jgi:hypothetical protein
MKYFFAAVLFFTSCEVFSQQSPSLDEILKKKIQAREILPVRKPSTHFPTWGYLYNNGVMITDSSFQPSALPMRHFYNTMEDDDVLFNLASSVKTYMADLERKKKEKK